MTKAPDAKTLPADRFLNRELSWLEFNQRVLDHADDPSVRLLERAKFLAITGSNLDEFFMVRVGSLKLQLEQNPRMVDLRGQTVAEQLAAVDARCRRMQADQDRILSDELEPRLAAAGIQRLGPDQWPQAQRDAAEAYFENNTLPVLSPQAIDPEVPPPLLPGLQIHLCVRLANGAAERAGAEGAGAERAGEGRPPWQFAVIPLGRSSHRIVSLPSERGYAYVLLEDLISDQVERFFPGREVLECVAFRISRNADVAVREDAAADLMVGIEEVLESRRESAAVRLELDERASEEATAFLCRLVGVERPAVYRCAAPLDLSYLFQLTSLDGFDGLRDDPWPAQSNPAIDPAVPMFETIARGDLLLVHPYERFDPVVRLIEEAAVDPDVLAIKQVLYRTSRNSPIVAALERAAERGKYVTAIVELKARFDEARNIEWARQMESAGVQVIYGVKGLKTHAKVCIIVRREPHGIVRYIHFGTGNYNEATARLYSDVSLLTSHEELAADATSFFNAVTGSSQPQQMMHLAAAPITLRSKILSMIEAETQRKQQGQAARITVKLNALVDPEIIDSLYHASRAGVRIRLNIRGHCLLRPGVPGLSENIEVVSIVDRYLEHARVLHFRHGGDELVYISSADWMPRNLDRRVELLVPVLDEGCQRKLIRMLDAYFADNISAWRLQGDGTYQRLQPRDGQEGYQAQRVLYERARLAVREAESHRRSTFEPHEPADRKDETEPPPRR